MELHLNPALPRRLGWGHGAIKDELMAMTSLSSLLHFHPPELEDRIELIHIGDGAAIARYKHVSLVIWRRAITSRLFDEVCGSIKQALAAYPQAAFLAIIEDSSVPPDGAIRQMMIRKLSPFENAPFVVSCVIEGTGFRASIARSASAAMRLLYGRRPPTNYSADVETALSWIARHQSISVPEHLAVASWLRAELDRIDPVQRLSRRPKR